MDVSYLTHKGDPKGRSKEGRPERQIAQQRASASSSTGKGQQKGRGQQNRDDDKSKKKCFYCGGKGHLFSECRTGGVCYNCHKQGHTQKPCTLPRRNVQQVDAEDFEDDDQDDVEPHVVMLQFWRATFAELASDDERVELRRGTHASQLTGGTGGYVTTYWIDSQSCG